MHRSKQHLYSIISPARATNAAGISRPRAAHDHEGTPVDQPGGKFLGDVWGHVVAARVWTLGDFTPSAVIRHANLPPLALQELGAFGRIDPPILNQQFCPALCRFERCFPDSGPSKPFFFESICQGGNCDPRGLTSFFYFGGPQACACHLIYQIPNHYRRGFVARQTGLAQHLQRVTGFRKVRVLAHGLLGTTLETPQCMSPARRSSPMIKLHPVLRAIQASALRRSSVSAD